MLTPVAICATKHIDVLTSKLLSLLIMLTVFLIIFFFLLKFNLLDMTEGPHTPL